jgi:hypothetical protein
VHWSLRAQLHQVSCANLSEPVEKRRLEASAERISNCELYLSLMSNIPTGTSNWSFVRAAV